MSADPWRRIESVIEAAVDFGQTPAAVAELDQLQGFFTQRLTALEVDVHDPVVLYEVLVVLGILYEAARDGAASGVFHRAEEVGVKRLTMTMAAALSRLLPEEARP